MNARDLFSERAADSETRIKAVRADLLQQLSQVEQHFETPEVCIYATGSLARLEATEHSDLDAFFYLSGTADQTPLSR